MKIAIVAAEDVTLNRLDAKYYVWPTKALDEQIRTTRRDLKASQRRLARLLKERAQVAADAAARGIDVPALPEGQEE